MQQFRQIDIDWDIHKVIEAERSSFDEPSYVALRRLLKLPSVRTASPSDKRKSEQEFLGSRRAQQSLTAHWRGWSTCVDRRSMRVSSSTANWS